MMTLAKRIRDCRYAKGWGPDELASRAEISRTALYQIECGKTETPRASTLRRIAKALDTSIDALMGQDDWDRQPGQPRLQQDAARPRIDSSAMSLDFDRPRANYFVPHPTALGRDRDLERKLHELLASPLGEGVARIVEETHRLLPAARLA